MRNLIAVVFLFAAGLIATAVWFSPLNSLGDVYAYDNNEAVCALDGLCYPSDALCRVDFCGDESDLDNALKKIGATVVKRVDIDGTAVVYAYSDRVCAAALFTAEGYRYNVMAAYADNMVCVGTPLLSGCY